MKIESNVALAPRTTLGVGGPAAHFVRAETEVDLREALDWADARGLPVRVLGGGSNVIIGDAGFSGLVVEIALRGVSISGDEARARAGESWDDFVAALVTRGYQGVECLSGIPGRVGATPIQNVGAYGQDVSERIVSVETIDTQTRARRVFSNAECGFGYRDSVFKSGEPGRYIVTEVCFRLTPNGPPALRYAELERLFSERGTASPSLGEVRDAVLGLRRSKSMVLDASDPNSRSCGSFFTNPVLSAAAFEGFSARAAETAPAFPQGGGAVKLSAGWLIERAGFAKGLRDGNVGLSTKHALALVARDGARAEEVLAFARRIQAGVHARFGVHLELEPVCWGVPQPTLA